METQVYSLLGFSFWEWSGVHSPAISLWVAIVSFVGAVITAIISVAKWKELKNRAEKGIKILEVSILLLIAILTLWGWKASDISSTKSEGLLTKALTNSEAVRRKTEALDPLKQHFASASAVVSIKVKGGKPMKYELNGAPLATLLIGRHADLNLLNLWSLHLVCDRCDKSGSANDNIWIFSMEFHPSLMLPLYNVRSQSVDIVDTFDCFELHAFNIPWDAEMLEGSIDLTVNSNVRRKFDIQPRPFTYDMVRSRIILRTNDIPKL